MSGGEAAAGKSEGPSPVLCPELQVVHAIHNPRLLAGFLLDSFLATPSRFFFALLLLLSVFGLPSLSPQPLPACLRFAATLRASDMWIPW